MPDYISHTQIETYLRCPLLYKYAYMHKIKRPASKSMLFGRAVHCTLEQYGRYYAKTSNHNAKMLSGLWSCTCEDRELVESPLSYEDYEKGRRMLLKLLEGPNLNLDSTVMLEYDFLLELAGVQVRGVVDRVDELSEGVYRVVDYKTGGAIFSGDDVESSLQLSIYAAAVDVVLQDHLNEKVRYLSVAIHQINQDVFIEREKLLEDIENAKQYVADINARIRSDTEMAANPGEACLRYGGCWAAHLCPEHQNVEMDSVDLAQASGADLLRMYTHLELRRKLVTDALKGKLEEEDQVLFGGRVASLESGNKYVFDDRTVWQLVENFDINPLELGNYDIRKYRSAIEAKRREILRSDMVDEEKDFMLAKLEECSKRAYEVVPSSPRLSVRKE